MTNEETIAQLESALILIQETIDFGREKAAEQVALLTDEGTRLADLIQRGVDFYSNMKAAASREKDRLSGV